MRLITSRPEDSRLLLAASTPTTELIDCTAASCSTRRAASPCSADMRSKDTSDAACTWSCSCPVLCTGNRSLGISTYSSAVSASVSSATPSVKGWWACTHFRPPS